MPYTVIENASVVLPDRVEDGWCAVCTNGKLAHVGPPGNVMSAGCERIDARGAYLAPGFIDLHIHGSSEWLVDDGPEALTALSGLLPSYGVTSFLPAVTPRENGDDVEFVADLTRVDDTGAEILGFLIEGRFLSERGALPAFHGGSSDAERAADLVQSAGGRAAVFAVSPEYPDMEKLLPLMTAGGVPAFITHTRATVEQTREAISLGAKHATHFYDVFFSPPETDPGVRPCGAVEAILADPAVSVDFILDGVHVHPAAILAALQCKGPDKVCLITDANRGAGLPGGRYAFGGFTVESADDGAPMRLTKDHPRSPGGLAGSGLTMDRALRNAVSMLDLDLPSAVKMASTNPAAVLGLGATKGRVAEGYDADLVLLDEELRPLATWVRGVCKYAREDAGHRLGLREEG